jgi:hypothetical protein
VYLLLKNFHFILNRKSIFEEISMFFSVADFVQVIEHQIKKDLIFSRLIAKIQTFG